MTDCRACASTRFLTVATWGFALVALVVASVLAGRCTAVLAVLSIGCIWLAATTAERTACRRWSPSPCEAALVGWPAALSARRDLPASRGLAVPAVHRPRSAGPGVRLPRWSTELSGTGLVLVVVRRASMPRGAPALVTWTIFSLGLALIGTFIHATYREPRRPARLLPQRPGPDPRADRACPDSLNSGLSPSPSAAQIASAVHDELPVRGLVVHVPR